VETITKELPCRKKIYESWTNCTAQIHYKFLSTGAAAVDILPAERRWTLIKQGLMMNGAQGVGTIGTIKLKSGMGVKIGLEPVAYA